MDLTDRIFNLLKERHPQIALSRTDLVELTGSPDRANREAIALLQAQGYPIISLGKGYYWAGDADLKKYKAREWTRVKSLAVKLKALFPQLHAAVEQMELGF